MGNTTFYLVINLTTSQAARPRNSTELLARADRLIAAVHESAYGRYCCKSRIQVKNPDGTWAERYGALAKEFNVSRCLISASVTAIRE